MLRMCTDAAASRYEDYLPQNLSQKVPTQRYFIASVLHNDVKRIPSFTRVRDSDPLHAPRLRVTLVWYVLSGGRR